MSKSLSRALELPPLDVDVAVVGSGAAGLAAALTAAERGLKVAVFEKDALLGGTSAWCSGWMWIPGACVEPLQKGDPAAALSYLQAELGPALFMAQRAKVEAFLKLGPEMLQFFQRSFPDTMAFEKDTETPDFHMTPGHRLGGRMVRVPAFDGWRLGKQLKRMRRPLPEFTVFGMAIEAGADLNAFLLASQFYRSLRALGALGRVAGRLARYLYELARYGRGMRLVNGNALVARMLASAERLGSRLSLHTEHVVTELICKRGAVDGLKVSTPSGIREVKAARGVVLAAGGFPNDMDRIRELFPPNLAFCAHSSAAPEQNTGDGLRLAEGAGGRTVPMFAKSAAAAFVPVSTRRRRDGSRAVYPHFVERAKPGVIAVQRDGRRFCNEAAGYHDFVQSWLINAPPGEGLRVWLICDWAFLFRFGLGMVRPLNPLPLGSLFSGYLKAGLTLESLAKRCGIDAAALRAQVERYNAEAPLDHQFHRGESDYDRSQGDPLMRPNPCVGRISLSPYFAVEMKPGSLGTLAGILTDEDARVLDSARKPVANLFACGNDMAAVMGGAYPTNGVTLASAMVFGFRAGSVI